MARISPRLFELLLAGVVAVPGGKVDKRFPVLLFPDIYTINKLIQAASSSSSNNDSRSSSLSESQLSRRSSTTSINTVGTSSGASSSGSISPAIQLANQQQHATNSSSSSSKLSTCSLNDQDWKMVFHYACALYHDLLMAKPAASGNGESEIKRSNGDTEAGFIILVDRRKDSWAAVNAILSKIQEHFPCPIKQVYLLPPESLLQKGIHGFGWGFRNNAFAAFNVTQCHNLTELHRFLPRDVLPSGEIFQGCLIYGQQIWALQRQELEQYISSIEDLERQSGDLIRQFCDSDLPNDATSTELLIAEQLEQRRNMKEDFNEQVQRGKFLIECFLPAPHYDDGMEASDCGVVNLDLYPDRLLNIGEVRRAMEVIRISEKEFDEAWLKHYMKMLECQQWRKFEEKFKDLYPRLQDHAMLLEQVDQELSNDDLTNASRTFQDWKDEIEDDIKLTEQVIKAGERLTSPHHIGDASIGPKCESLTELVYSLSKLISRCVSALSRLYDVQNKLNKAESWYSRGQSTLTTGSQEDEMSPNEELDYINKYLEECNAIDFSPEEHGNGIIPNPFVNEYRARSAS